MEFSRRNFVRASGLVAAGAGFVSGRAAFANVPEAPSTKSPATQAPLMPSTGPDYQPVVTLNGWSLPWRMNGDWKEFHLVAEPVVREIAAHIVMASAAAVASSSREALASGNPVKSATMV